MMDTLWWMRSGIAPFLLGELKGRYYRKGYREYKGPNSTEGLAVFVLIQDKDGRFEAKPANNLVELKIFNAGGYRPGESRRAVLCRDHEVSRWRWADSG
jgi:hypothetical protein